MSSEQFKQWERLKAVIRILVASAGSSEELAAYLEVLKFMERFEKC